MECYWRMDRESELECYWRMDRESELGSRTFVAGITSGRSRSMKNPTTDQLIYAALSLSGEAGRLLHSTESISMVKSCLPSC